MDYWATTGGLALGLPISFGLAGIVQLTRWRAAKLAQPIPEASEVDQDALKKERAAKDAANRSKAGTHGRMLCAVHGVHSLHGSIEHCGQVGILGRPGGPRSGQLPMTRPSSSCSS